MDTIYGTSMTRADADRMLAILTIAGATDARDYIDMDGKYWHAIGTVDGVPVSLRHTGRYGEAHGKLRAALAEYPRGPRGAVGFSDVARMMPEGSIKPSPYIFCAATKSDDKIAREIRSRLVANIKPWHDAAAAYAAESNAYHNGNAETAAWLAATIPGARTSNNNPESVWLPGFFSCQVSAGNVRLDHVYIPAKRLAEFLAWLKAAKGGDADG